MCLNARPGVDITVLQNLWDVGGGPPESPLELLRYRSNLLGEDLRITNFGGGNTSSKFALPDPLTGEPTRVMAVKGSGGDLRSITATGFAMLYLDKLEALIARYRGEAHEDEMVGFYPLCAFGENRVAASIDTPLHAFLPFPHVDHLHPDWAIALAASANGARKLEEFNRSTAANRVGAMAAPGLRAGLMLQRRSRSVRAATASCSAATACSPGARRSTNAISAASAPSTRWVRSSRRTSGPPTGRVSAAPRLAEVRGDRAAVAAAILPYLRGVVSSNRRTIAHWDSSEDALTFAASTWAEALCGLWHELPRSLPAHAHQPDVHSGNTQPSSSRTIVDMLVVGDQPRRRREHRPERRRDPALRA